MSTINLLLVAVGLAMDAFAAAVCKGLNMRKINYKHAAIIAAFFGFFQGIMPVLGWSLGKQFHRNIDAYDHWVTFALLCFIGGKMIYEAVNGKKKEQTEKTDELDITEVFILAIATSIDALAVGVTFAFLEVNIWQSVSFIGVITFMLSILGVIIGNNFGVKYKKRAEIAGGLILMLIGTHVLVEHIYFL